MPALDKTDWEILNATADDCENLEQIYRQVSYELLPPDPDDGLSGGLLYRPVKGAPLLSEVAEQVRSLVERGLLIAVADEEGRPLDGCTDLSYVWRAWFAMTPEGRKAWESSAHLAEPAGSRRAAP